MVKAEGNKDWARGITQCMWAVLFSLLAVIAQIINLKVMKNQEFSYYFSNKNFFFEHFHKTVRLILIIELRYHCATASLTEAPSIFETGPNSPGFRHFEARIL